MPTYIGTPDNDTIVSDAAEILALAGDDTVQATSGLNTTIDGGEGSDLLRGGDDDTWDLLLGGEGADTLHGGWGEGRDTLSGGAGDDVLTIWGGSDFVRGGEGVDTLDFAALDGPVRADLHFLEAGLYHPGGDSHGTIYYPNPHHVFSIVWEVENVVGSAFNDVLKGDNSENTLWGGQGDDVISGFGDSDLLVGGAGNDTIAGQGGHDTVDGSEGADRLSGGARGWDVFKFDYRVDAFPAFDATIIDWEDGADRIRLRDVFRTADGGEADGPIFFGDLTIAQDGADVLITHWRYFGEIRVLNQWAANLTRADFDLADPGTEGRYLLGGFGDDSLVGGRGEDRIEGWKGDDTLTGAEGRDFFVFYIYSDHEPGPDWGNDVITDFEHGRDLIDMRTPSTLDLIGIEFTDLTIAQQGADTLITYGPKDTILLLNQTASDISAGDFLFGHVP